ncbi:BTAD domain-containing putative transcriptional regulator [Nocardioides bizhenqiangii]|uniref:BTAD domain-containing putative transcriptional regulator n=1 Tax=Nocardioides bizhenqiangii TaxID=3095076 RepID=A0ABZ0ZTM7_9ACTN|nr:BTAD domain-containing putative transcriptional regulator [Nocardioides sp. HM61]WQQ27164.1 BTAD domain-containing putative transcriptional regulator [Nocardioides sp. HM61]
MEIDLLGGFAVRRDGRTVPAAEFGGRRVRQLVRVLAAERGRVSGRDTLIDILWGDQPPADPATNLNVVVNRARRALSEPGAIQTSGGGYLLQQGAGIVVDAEVFEEHVQDARAAHGDQDFAAAAAAADAALGVWGEPLPEDAYADWARPYRDRLERLHQEALEIGAEAHLGAGRARVAVDLASRAVARQPLREAAHAVLMRALAADGDQAAALSCYLDLRRVLAAELGVDPSPETTALYERLLHGEVPAPPVVRPARGRSGVPPLVGRDREHDELRRLGGEHRVALLAGRSGWGKTRLLEDLRAGADRPVLSARALLPEREEPWSLVRSLLDTSAAAAVDLARILGPASFAAVSEVIPDLDGDPAAVAPESRRALALQALVRVIEATTPSLVLVDDLQWADSSSLDVLALLVGRDADLAMVLAYRPEEVLEGSPVAQFLAGAAAGDSLEVSLQPLEEDALRELVGSASVAAGLAEHSDRSPFAVLQVARVLEREGLLQRTDDGGWRAVVEPPADRVREVARAGQREAAWRQYERLSATERDLVAALALLGRPVPLRLLADALDLPTDDALRVVGDLARGHLVRHEAAGFRVDHDLVAETIRDRVDPSTGARLHQRLASALASTGATAEECARHLLGAGDTTAAAEAYVEAARARVERCADREAEQLASEGLALDPAPELRAALLEIRAETSARQGTFGAAREDLRAAIAVTTKRPTRSRLFTRMAQLTLGTEDLLRASELADLALTEAGEDRAARARATYVRALVDMNLDRPQTAEAGLDEALALFTAVGDTHGVADILDARAMTVFGFGDILGGIVAFERVARLFTDNGNLLRAVTPRSTRGHGLVFAARPQEGLADTTAALELTRSLGYAEGEAMVLWHHAEALLACGRPEEAREVAESGVTRARGLGHRGWTATTLRALGIARAALGDLDGARAAFEESVRTSGEHLLMFRSWGHSRLALVHVAEGHPDAAAPHVAEALATGPGLALYEARLAECELAVARGDDGSAPLVRDAHQRAVTGGHAVSAQRLAALLSQVT